MRILLVDPSRTALMIVSRLLEARDHEVRPFTDAQQALDYLAADPLVDALLTSVEIGEGSGFELCWSARLIAGDRRPLYIIVMSANYEHSHLAEALDSGADDFIGKPPVPEELYARLRAAERLAGMQRDLIRMATTDPLTGVLNRRAFFAQAEDLCEQARRGAALSAVMLDIDHFKQINDTYGHDVGDAAIRGVANVANQVEGGVFGRLGGEEFGLLLGSRTSCEAEILAEDLRRTIAELRFPTSEQAVSLTCSLGVSEWQEGDAIETTLKRADAALYRAKSDGRNRVVSANASRLPDHEHPNGVIRAVRHG